MHTKKSSLEMAETMGWTDPDMDLVQYTYYPEDKKTGYFEGIGMNVLDNLQVFLEDVHIRYEDKENDYAFGISLDRAHLYSANEEWEMREKIGDKIMRKVFFHLYCSWISYLTLKI